MKNKMLKTGFYPLLLLLVPVFAPAQTPAAPGSSTQAVTTVEQTYRPVTMRGPLRVSTVFGDEHAPGARAGLSELVNSTFSIYNLALTGVLEDRHSKEAMLKDLSTGAIYILKGGKLLDSKKKQVPGVSGVIKGKQIILMTEDKKVNQLNLQEKN
jgi:hypothetical protein